MARRVLFLTVPPIAAASTRYRIAQYFPSLEAAGIEYELCPFISPGMFGSLYRRGGYARKAAYLSRAVIRRLGVAMRSGGFDAVFVAREAMMFGPPLIEWLIAKASGRPMIFDFDDAVWVPYDSPTYGSISRLLRPPSKTSRVIAMSAEVIAGNDYLAGYARQFNPRVTVIPTVVDHLAYQEAGRRSRQKSGGRLVIGWVGTHSTAQYLKLLAPALAELASRHRFTFRVIGGPSDLTIPGVEVENRPWRLESELDDFGGMDIGVYPIVEDDWSLGKCAFKAIQFMAAGVPCVSSPVGMTREVVSDGIDGLLAGSVPQWIEALEALIIDPERRRRLGEAGMRSIAERYSLQACSELFVATIHRAIGQSGGGGRPK